MSAAIVEGGADVVILHNNGIPRGVRVNGVEIPGVLGAQVMNEPNQLVHVRIDVLVNSVTWEHQR